MAEVRFHIAGMPVAIRGEALAIADLAPVYRQFPTDAPAALTIEIERVAGFDRAQGPAYPAFQRRVDAAGRLRVERFDAEGEIETGDLPLAARFRVGPSANSLEACVRIAASVALARHGALILHASAVEHAGRALVFTGVSGAGKSTISAMLDRAPARKIGDELLVLRRDATVGAWSAYVPPYLGPAGIAHGAQAPLDAVHLLVQAPHHARTLVGAAAALRELLRHVLVYVAEPRTADHVLAIAADLTREVPCYRLEFRKDPGVARVLGIAYPGAAPA
ncbi:MAG: hypothetical protein HS111_18720 [Kofleriaceae bacterium]|nr:hypothetical protein [Kofleriaceae bacterium]MCL4224132.1 hypothetical protein [Myxococcales bacterium]